MISDWELFDAVLQEKGIPREVMIYPERYMDQYNVTRRKCAIREMHKRGISEASLTSLTPFTRRYIHDIILNGSGTNEVDQNLPFSDSVLSLRDENGA